MTNQRLVTGLVLVSALGAVLAACQPSQFLTQDSKSTSGVEIEAATPSASPVPSASPSAMPAGPGQAEIDAMEQADQATDPTVYGSSSFETQLNF